MVTYLRPASCAADHRLLQRALVADLGELDQHRQVDAGEHLDLRPAHHGNREVGRRAAEHVGEDSDAVAGVDALDRLDDVLAALFDVIVGTDGHGLDLLLRADHMLERRAEFDGEPPVRNENETDHQTPRGRVPVAPHERTVILTIRSPCARAFLPILTCMLHCGM